MTIDHIICVRNVKGGRFGDEPGPTKFLRVPRGESPSPDHATRRQTWAEEVMAACPPDDDSSPDRRTGDLLIFIHGYNNSQEIVMQRHRRLHDDLATLGFHGAVVSFDWPSADSALNYLEDRSDAKQTALSLVADGILLFSKYQQQDCPINVHLLAHSAGAYVIREAFDDADDRPRIAAANWTVSQIMLIGADISQKSMSEGNPKSTSLIRHAVRITNFSNPHDVALKISNVKRIGVAPRVGRTGLPGDAPPSCINIDCGPYWETLRDKHADITDKHSHSWHIGDPLFTRDMLYTMQGDIERHSIPTRRLIDGRLVLHPPT